MPATGVVSMVLPVMVQRRIQGYVWMVASFVGIGFLSFGLWAHHMFTVGLPAAVLAFFAASSMAISIPAGVQIFSWLATIWEGRVRWTTPFLFVVGFLVIFVAGGITGVMVAAVPFDQQVHDSYFVVAHLHYVLIGGVAFPMFAGVYYWFPKFTGRMMSERLGRWNFWLLFVGVNVTFFPMHLAGLAGMQRRVYTYAADTGWGTWNLLSSSGLLLIIPGLALFMVNLARSYRRGRPAGNDPWGGDSLEWAIPSPPPEHGWTVPPLVTSRHPLWDQTELHRAEDDRTTALARALSQWPLRWRAALVVGTGDARPQEIFRVSDPSIWPLVAALGMVGIFAAELFHVRIGALFSVLVILFAAIMWNRPHPAPMTREEELAFEVEHGVPVRATGSLVIPRWGMGLGILFLAIAFSSFLLAYFYLRLENPQWPPEPVPDPTVGTGVAAVVAVVLGPVALWAARRAISRDETGSLLAWTGAALVAGAVGVAVFIRDLAGLGFTPQDHAYGSIVFTFAGFAVLVVAIGLIMGVAVVVYALRGHYNAQRFSPVDNVARYWTAAGAMWAVALGTIYLAPHLT